MRKETIAKDDGRYLIYYTFDDAPSSPGRPEGAPSPDDSTSRWEKGEKDSAFPAAGGVDEPGSGAEPEA